MNAPIRPSAASHVDPFAHDQHGVSAVKNPSRNEVDQVSASRKAFAALLWRAFPSHSEHDLAIKAARVLDVTPRQVQNWLRCEHSASVHVFFAVASIAGAELVFRGGGQ